MIGDAVKYALHGFIRALIVKPALGASIGFAVFALIGLALYLLLSGALTPPPPQSVASSSSAADDFLRGNQEYDARLIWNALNDEARQSLERRGGAQAWQAQLDEARSKGVKLEVIKFVGSEDLPDGTSMRFYLVGERSPQTQGELEYTPYVFTIDRGGKIAKVQ